MGENEENEEMEMPIFVEEIRKRLPDPEEVLSKLKGKEDEDLAGLGMDEINENRMALLAGVKKYLDKTKDHAKNLEDLLGAIEETHNKRIKLEEEIEGLELKHKVLDEAAIKTQEKVWELEAKLEEREGEERNRLEEKVSTLKELLDKALNKKAEIRKRIEQNKAELESIKKDIEEKEKTITEVKNEMRDSLLTALEMRILIQRLKLAAPSRAAEKREEEEREIRKRLEELEGKRNALLKLNPKWMHPKIYDKFI